MVRFAASLFLGIVFAAAPVSAAEMTVSVAVSMREAIEEIGRHFAAARPGVSLRYNLGASGDLQRQIEAGAPADVFVSAGARQMDELERAGLLLPATRRIVARNVLVALKPHDSALDIPGPSDLLDRRVQRIAIGNPKTVPAGQYAEEALRVLGVWERVKPKLVYGENVRQVLEWIVRGEVDAGIVYATDGVMRLGRARLAFAFPEDSHRPILYPAAVVKATREPDLARAFVEFLMTPQSQAVLAKLGFEQTPPAAR